MALPPKGDPRRPLHLAIRSSKGFAIVFLCLGLLTAAQMFTAPKMPSLSAAATTLVVITLLYWGPGVAYLTFVIYMRRRRYWAVRGCLILASIQLLMLLTTELWLISRAMVANTNASSSPVTLAVLTLMMLALLQLIYYLALSFEAINYAPLEEQAGFEPVMAPPMTSDAKTPSSNGDDGP